MINLETKMKNLLINNIDYYGIESIDGGINPKMSVNIKCKKLTPLYSMLKECLPYYKSMRGYKLLKSYSTFSITIRVHYDHEIPGKDTIGYKENK